jgi:hypothetical protein
MKKPFTFALFVAFACGGLRAEACVAAIAGAYAEMAGGVPFHETVGRLGAKLSRLVAANPRLASSLR